MKSGGASYQSGEGVPPQASDYFNMGGRKMKAGKSGKKARIALKFTNDSGEDFQLGADIDV